ncbi:MAG: helix-turn-helix transcriptional regulator [Chloroflexi bacterium]|nr:helix-turn-helix transcriptional regulator [Chloroflexota bacterium]
MVESIGERIKALRQKRQFTLAKLAEQANLSASHLSQVERDKASPSLMTLNSIAQALEVNLRDLFESEADQVHITRATHTPESENGPLPVGWARLTSRDNGWDLQVHRLTLPASAPPLDFEPYSGEILAFVVEGVLAISIDGERFELQAGDSLHSDARQPHSLGCAGDQPCVILWCNSPPREITEMERRWVDRYWFLDQSNVAAIG